MPSLFEIQLPQSIFLPPFYLTPNPSPEGEGLSTLREVLTEAVCNLANQSHPLIRKIPVKIPVRFHMKNFLIIFMERKCAREG